VIQRGGGGELVLDEREALSTLLSNCEDAYGFPPYSAIEGFLRGRNGTDLADTERAIVAHALQGLPATLIRSDSMDWWMRLPDVVTSWNGHVEGNGHRERAPVHA
jgi:dolichol-phosphate mannosyltransferase